jgi:hypothetical protein
MAMGTLAANNIYKHILASESEASSEQKLSDFPHVPPMIALALGTKAATYSPQDGVNSSEELLKIFFGDDLGHKSK